MRESGTTRSPGNALLDRFPADVRDRLDATDEHHKTHDVLFRADDLPKWAHFPHLGTIISLTRTTQEGTTVEVGIIGWEGVAAVQSLLLPRPSGSRAVVQLAGSTSRVRLQTLRAVRNDNAAARELLAARLRRRIPGAGLTARDLQSRPHDRTAPCEVASQRA